MNWLSFFIGVLVGLIIAWLIDLLFLRRRRAAAEADLRLKLEDANKESTALKAQLSGYEGLQVRLDDANSQVAALQAQVTEAADLRGRLDGASSEIESLIPLPYCRSGDVAGASGVGTRRRLERAQGPSGEAEGGAQGLMIDRQSMK